MGLAERRVIKAYQEGEYQNFLSEVKDVIGDEIEFDIDWDSLPNEKYTKSLEQGLTEIYFKPILNSFKVIAEDEMGKEAIRESVKKIVIKDENDNAYASKTYKFNDGVLIVDHCSYTNIGNTDERTKLLTKLLESNL
ncbi:hypothetical protein [Tenacibaculum sp. M341]|uniref:hypothetical protein n=1 Tax=Tenacibaculum sp. M341 TaxID=2530339 RepID=UPI00104EAC61|nr:hypothetical protein [Tenacibaculum sp. M341]TCI90773.1 hypothetical protein EYW44_13710 [Tenacibaculum sp. M341]